MAGQIPVNVNETYGPRSGSTPTSNYTPTSDDFLIDIDVDFVTRPITPVIHLVQYDYILPVLAFHLYSNRNGRPLPSGCVASIRINNGNGTVYYKNADGVSNDRMTVYFKITSDLCVSPGFKPGVIELSNAQGLINSSPFSVEVEQNPVSNDIVEEDESYISLATLLDQTEKWREDGSPHLTNNSYIVTGKASATDVANNATAEGLDNNVHGIRSHAEGYNNTITANGTASHAEGSGNTVSAASAHVEGSGSVASAANAHAEGNACTASGMKSHAEGDETTSSGEASHAEGSESTASGAASHAEGGNTISPAPFSHAEGWWTKTVTDPGASASTMAGSHSEGFATKARGVGSHAEGYGYSGNDESGWVYANGSGTHAEGHSTKATNDCAHAEGWFSQATGAYSHAEGWNTVASGESSHASGRGTVAGYQAQFACGEFNENSQDNVFEVGNGADGSNRRNAFWVQRNGIVYLGLNSLNSDSIMTLMRYTNPIILPPRTREAPTVDAYHSKGKIDLTTSSEITPGNDGIMTGTLTGVCPDTIYEQCYHSRAIEYGKRFPKHILNNYMPFFNTVFIKNTDTGTYRKVLEVGTTYAITNYDSSTNTFDLTVSTHVINLSDTTPIASNVVIRKEIWAMCYPDMN